MSKTFQFGINVDISNIIKDITGIFEKSSFSEKWYDNNQGRWLVVNLMD